MKCLDQAMAMVRDFHRVMGQPHPAKPTRQPLGRAKTRGKWIRTETHELTNARTIVDQADAYIDGLYFCLGGLVELGIDPSPLLEIAHAANMAKVQPDGTVHRRADGKIIKPEGWVAPEPLMAAEIERQIAAAA